ncbi:hypothetical protein BABINDRAFT_163081 [Babjeviella inositovora NRRL Y-12698]|uniref:RNA polymerase-associated protein CTR9 n=1 Tax=Babjeviella inositovora NRRL Y-12698 TaxID=984486 RepID=A0A1E3QK30_9ASCO|nr:uncharacterized protein BABINDRAFT_163081 [Babjeviella inositovora NRRL Y-12698]ODQ78049.1 hypothetical protein BABINDRAFT_163081 [Babjeviella inositovora NRRL Y-12698]
MTDARAFYVKDSNNTFVLPTSIDIPILSEPGQVVSVDITNDLPEGSDIVNLLQNEQAPQQYWLNFAQAFVTKTQYNDAEEVLTNAVASPQFALADAALAFHVFLAWLYLRQSEAGGPGSTALLRSATAELQQHASLPLFVLTQAIVLLTTAHYDQALDLFAQVLVLQPSNTVALTGRAHILLHRQQYGAALKLYQQVLILNPLLTPDSRIGIGLCFWFLGDTQMAQRAWERSLAVAPSAEARLLLTLAQFDALFTRSLSDAEFVTSYRTALTAVKDQQALDPENATVRLMLAAHHYARGEHEETARLAGAVIQQLATAAPPGSREQAHAKSHLAVAHFLTARVSFAQQDYTLAQKHFHDSIRLNDQLASSKLGLAQAQLARGSPDEAVMTLESALKGAAPGRERAETVELIYALGVLYAAKALADARAVEPRIKAIAHLEKYVRAAGKEPVILNVYLLLSQLHEQTDVTKASAYLQKAVVMLKKQKREIPLSMMNNCGVFEFGKGNFQNAKQFFELAKQQNDGDATAITLDYNYARVSEDRALYDDILVRCPSYTDAKLRVLFLSTIEASGDTDKLHLLHAELKSLVDENPDSTALRSMYGWFLHNHAKALQLAPELESSHHKLTVTNVDSHDTYALMCLANLYYTIAKDIRSSAKKDVEKKNQYFVRAAQLFQKVIKVDKLNVFAAQGIAILLIDFQHSAMGLEIFRKVRDSLNDLSIFVNMGHTYLQLHQFAKAIECYELGLARFTTGDDARILSFLGKAWLLRGLAEKSLSCLSESVKYAEKAYQLNDLPALKFNIAYVQFQIAGFVLKMTTHQRTLKDLEDAAVGLEDAIQSMAALAKGTHPPYPADDLQARANMGENTTRKQLADAIQEQQAFVSSAEQKLAEALKQKETEQAKLQKERDEQLARETKAQEQMAAERAKLQEQASEWVNEMASYVDGNVSDDDNKDFEAEPKKKKGGKRKKKFINDSDNEEESDDGAKKPRKRKESALKPDSKKRKVISNDLIEDSDEELEGEGYAEEEAGSDENLF